MSRCNVSSRVNTDEIGDLYVDDDDGCPVMLCYVDVPGWVGIRLDTGRQRDGQEHGANDGPALKGLRKLAPGDSVKITQTVGGDG